MPKIAICAVRTIAQLCYDIAMEYRYNENKGNMTKYKINKMVQQ